MGNLTGCKRRPDGLTRVTRNPAEEQKYIEQIFAFDWNQGLKKQPQADQRVTVEENIALRLTNDNGEQVTPQVAHVAFTEFKKFMFLNKIYVGEKEKAEAAQQEENKATEERPPLGLYAPPLIDSVWSILISLDVPAGKS